MHQNLQNSILPAENAGMNLEEKSTVDSPRVPENAASPEPWRIVYLLSCYPAVSHTFFLGEIRQLRKLGFTIEPASINPPDRPRSSLSPVEVDEADQTFYIKPAGIAHAVAVSAKTLLLRPTVFVRGVAAALRLGRSDPAATLYALFYLAEAFILGDWMRSRGHRHLHIHFCGPVATVGMLVSMAWGFSYSLTVHGPDEFYDVEKFYLRLKVEQAKFILCISDFCRSQLMRIVAPEHWEKMHVVRLGIDPDVFVPRRKQDALKSPLEVLCVGRLVPSKGQLILLRACSLLHAEGISLQVRLVGDGPDREHLEAFASQMKINVIFEGAKSHDQTRKLLGQADIFALASFAEGVPVALMEAMAMEIPCVSTTIAGIPELIRDGLDGLLVPASSVEALASALRRLAEDPLLRSTLASEGRKRVLSHYNLPHNVRSLAAVLRLNAPNSSFSNVL
jgi:glycosyltransferase involved in cell wall biosynthesis